MADVCIPAALAAAGHGLPDRCAAHGGPAVRRAGFAARSRPALPSRRRLLTPGHTAFDRAGEYLGKVRVLRVAGWPLCARCVRRRRAGLAVTALLLVGGALTAVTAAAVAVAAPGDRPLLALPILAGLAAVLLAAVPFARAALPVVARAVVTDDGGSVEVRDPHPAFVTRLPHP